MELIDNKYKKTEVGLIPNEWEVKSIEEIALVDPESLSNTSTNPEYLFKYISLEDVDNGVLRNYTELQFRDAPSRARRILRKNDILFSTVRPNLKSHLLITEDVPDLICSTGFSVIRCKEIEVNCSYVYNHLFAAIINSQVDRLITGSNYPAINSKEVRSLKISFPQTKSEQTVIATALSDTDALIENLEKLIAKKRDIKQGIIQMLLKPKVDWENKYLPDVCWFQEGPGLRNWQFTSNGIKVINVTNLENGVLNLDRTARYISLEEFHKMYEHFEIDENDIVVASSGNSYGKVAVVRKVDLPLVMNTSVIRFKPLKQLVFNYLFIFLKSYLFKKQVDFLITGGAQPNFGPAHLNQVIIPIPPSKKEQIEISTIIVDMDTEIVALEQKLLKYKMLKKSMMQVLLTGKIRIL